MHTGGKEMKTLVYFNLDDGRQVTIQIQEDGTALQVTTLKPGDADPTLQTSRMELDWS